MVTDTDFCTRMQSPWWEVYIGKPWAAVPNPPQTFTCGELCRWILRDRLGVDTMPVYADAGILRQCVDNLSHPDLYDLYPAEPPLRPYDLAFLIRVKRRDHLGIAVQTSEGLRILHCQQGVGVVLDSPADLFASGYRRIEWYRHKSISEETALCRA
jgi:hypothetical protein